MVNVILETSQQMIDISTYDWEEIIDIIAYDW